MTRKPFAYLLAGIILFAPTVLSAATFTVTRFDDPAPVSCTAIRCSLREAIQSANSLPGADRIVLKAGTYHLTRIDLTPLSLEPGIGALPVTGPLAIIGQGVATTRVRWAEPTPGAAIQGQHEVFAVSGTSGGVSLDLQDLTISHGRGAQGGCISVLGPTGASLELVLRASIIEHCSTSGYGGAIRTEGSSLTLSGVQLRNNSAARSGGAIAFFRTAEVNSSDVQIFDNTADSGGAIALVGNPVPYIPNLVWVDNGSLLISGNTAQRGGAISIFLAQLTMQSSDPSSAGNWIEVSENQAAEGGAVYSNGVSSTVQQFSRVRFLSNRAGSGGAILATDALSLISAEFFDNEASTGDGGAVLLPNNSNTGAATFDEVSFHHNRAKGGGGALRSGCRGFGATNVSFGYNVAASTRGQAIESTGPSRLRHATLHSNRDAQNGTSPGVLQVYEATCGNGSNEIMRLANSLITDYCGFNVARLRSEGGNQYGPNAGVCPAVGSRDRRLTSDSLFRLSESRFGGPVAVWGWTTSSLIQVPQYNGGLSAACVATDVRGLPRTDGRCDTGAFEQQ